MNDNLNYGDFLFKIMKFEDDLKIKFGKNNFEKINMFFNKKLNYNYNIYFKFVNGQYEAICEIKDNNEVLLKVMQKM